MNTKLLVDRFLAWPLPESLCSDPCASMPGYPHRTGTNLMTAEHATAMIEHVIAAPCQPEGEGLEVVAWNITVKMDGRTWSEYTEKLPFLPDAKVTWHSEPEPVCRLSDHLRATAELREECERLRVKLMTIASAEPGRHNIEWAKAMAATGNNDAYAKWREAFDQRDKLAGLLREKFPRIDPENPYPLDEVEHHCEYTLYQERERLHREIDAAISSGK